MKRTHMLLGISAVAFIVIASGAVIFFLMQSKQGNVTDKPAESVVTEQSPVGYTPTPPAEVDSQYKNKDYGFTLYLPEYWNGKYDVTEKKNVVFFRHLPSALLHPENDEYGTLFKALLYDNKEEWRIATDSLPNVLASYILTNDNSSEKATFVIFQIPTEDVISSEDDEEITRDYFNLISALNWLSTNERDNCFSGLIEEKVMPDSVVKFPELVPVVKGGHIEITSNAILYTSPNGKALKIAGYPSFSDLGEGVMSVRYLYGFNIYLGICDPFYALVLFDKSGTVIADPKYNFIESFVEGMARCCIGVAVDDFPSGKYGFINTKGEEVIPLKYNEVTAFSEGLAVVQYYETKTVAYIDKTGEEVLLLPYEYASPFSEGLAAVKVNDNYGFIDKTGKMVIEPKPYGSIGQFSEGLVEVNNGEGKYGYMNKAGDLVIDFEYSYATPFRNGYAFVSDPDVVDSGYGYDGGAFYGKLGVINKKGELIVPYTYQAIYFEGNNLFRARLPNEKQCIINNVGDIVIPPDYYSIYPASPYPYYKKTGAVDFIVQTEQSTTDNKQKLGIISSKGEVVVPVEYDNIEIKSYIDREEVIGMKDGEETTLRTYEK